MSSTLIVLGAGHMGSAIIHGLLKRGFRSIKVVDPNPVCLDRHRDAGLEVSSELCALAADEVVMLAMPPQAFLECAATNTPIRGHTGPIISVMAGIRIATLKRALGVSQVVRAIPNTPSEVFHGMSVYCASPETTEQNLVRCARVLEAIGRLARVHDEALLDPATALCGGGPAFVAYFVNALQRFARGQGFNDESSRMISVQVLKGTAELLLASDKEPMQICREVMTPQGTTERAIWHFDDAHLDDIIVTALGKSASRSAELGALLNVDHSERPE